MTVDELVTRLDGLLENKLGDEERTHQLADALLLQFINDVRVRDAFLRVPKFY
jgi:hypothetical protein